MSQNREIAYRLDPALWVGEVLGETPTAWQKQFLRAARGASVLVLTARQVGKTTAAAWAMAHSALFEPKSLSVVACPAHRQSAEAVRKVRDVLQRCGAKILTDNVITTAQPHARAAAVLVDELDARGLKCSPNNVECRGPGLATCSLQLMDGHDADSGFFRELILAPR